MQRRHNNSRESNYPPRTRKQAGESQRETRFVGPADAFAQVLYSSSVVHSRTYTNLRNRGGECDATLRRRLPVSSPRFAMENSASPENTWHNELPRHSRWHLLISTFVCPRLAPIWGQLSSSNCYSVIVSLTAFLFTIGSFAIFGRNSRVGEGYLFLSDFWCWWILTRAHFIVSDIIRVRLMEDRLYGRVM